MCSVGAVAGCVGHASVSATVVCVIEVEFLSWQHGLLAEVAGLAVGVGEHLGAELLVLPSEAAP